MSDWAAKRFWNDADVKDQDDGFAILLDDRPLKTPTKNDLVLPNRDIAELVVQEWRDVEEKIDPEVMPFTRFANSAIDRMPTRAPAVREMLREYAETDLLCYRADKPEGLVARQTAAWDPLLDWAQEEKGLKFDTTFGILPIDQPEVTINEVTRWLENKAGFHLMGLHDLVTLAGSFVIAMAVFEGHQSAETGWKNSRIDEDWQAEKWGIDSEAKAQADAKRAEFLRAALILSKLD